MFYLSAECTNISVGAKSPYGLCVGLQYELIPLCIGNLRYDKIGVARMRIT